MTREQTKTCLEAAVKAGYFGAAKRSRLVWCLRQVGLELEEARDFIDEMLCAKLMEVHVDRFDPWVSATPFLVGISANFDELASDIWHDDTRGGRR